VNTPIRRRGAGGPTGSAVWQAAAITLVLQVPSLADVYKYVGQPTLAAPVLIVGTYVVILAALVVVPRWSRLTELVGSAVVSVVVLVGLTITSVVLFRHETARLEHGSGSTASQAMSFPVHALLDGRHLYDVVLAGHAPVSPGPGWILLNSPFTVVHAYALMLPFWLALTVVVLRWLYRRPFEVNLGLLFVCLSPGAFRLLGEGHDILAIGCVAVLLVALADRFVAGGVSAAVVGIASGVFATARIVFTPIPVLLALLVWSRSRTRAAIVAVVGLATAAVAHGAFALGIDPYPPVHLFDRANDRQPTANVAIGVLATAFGVACLLRYRRRDVVSWFAWFAACFATPLVFIGFGEIEHGDRALAHWEGANYLLAAAVPVITGVLASRARAADPGCGGSGDEVVARGGDRHQDEPAGR
jgi:hypothetical protein